MLCNNWCTYVNCGWHDSVHIRTLPLTFFLIRHQRYYLECCVSNFRDFYCDPLKSRTRRIYSYLRVVPIAMITEHPSLCIRSRDLACCNCLRKIRKLNPEIAFVDTRGASSLSQAVLSSSSSRSPSSQGAGPSSQGAGPSSQGAGPSSQGAGPSSQGAGPSSQVAGPSSQGAGPSSQGAGPSSPSQEGAGPSTIGSELIQWY